MRWHCSADRMLSPKCKTSRATKRNSRYHLWLFDLGLCYLSLSETPAISFIHNLICNPPKNPGHQLVSKVAEPEKHSQDKHYDSKKCKPRKFHYSSMSALFCTSSTRSESSCLTKKTEVIINKTPIGGTRLSQGSTLNSLIPMLLENFSFNSNGRQ